MCENQINELKSPRLSGLKIDDMNLKLIKSENLSLKRMLKNKDSELILMMEEIKFLKENQKKYNLLIKKILEHHKIYFNETEEEIFAFNNNFNLFNSTNGFECKKNCSQSSELNKTKNKLLIDSLQEQMFIIKRIQIENKEELENLKTQNLEITHQYIVAKEENENYQKEINELKDKIKELSNQLDENIFGNQFLKDSLLIDNVGFDTNTNFTKNLNLDNNINFSTQYFITVTETDDQIINPNEVYYVKDTEPKIGKDGLSVKTENNIRRTPTVDRILTEKIQNGEDFEQFFEDSRIHNFIKQTN